MINIIFGVSNENYVFQIKKDNINWNTLFGLISTKLNIPKNRVRISNNGKFFHGNTILPPFELSSLIQEGTKGDFIIFKVSVLPNI